MLRKITKFRVSSITTPAICKQCYAKNAQRGARSKSTTAKPKAKSKSSSIATKQRLLKLEDEEEWVDSNKAEPVQKVLACSLEELYNGTKRKLRISRQRICRACDGIGATDANAMKTCPECNGIGQLMAESRDANGYFQSTSGCVTCDNKGYVIDSDHVCSVCDGQHTVTQLKVITVAIGPGMREGERIVLEGEGDERPDKEPGDVMFVIQEKPHAVFKRVNNDLIIKKNISLSEALTGFRFVVEHLDGRKLLITSNQSEIISPGQMKQVTGEGMPISGDIAKGNLLILFEIDFPASLPLETLQKLKALLPEASPLPDETDIAGATQCQLSEPETPLSEPTDNDKPDAPIANCMQQ